MPLFCRHNRLETSCPICSREKAPPPRSRSAPARARLGSAPAARRHGSGSRAGGLVTRKLARASDDGYRHDLVPGVRATADAERLATALAVAAARLEYPGPYPAVAELDDAERATELAFLLALAGPDDPARQAAVLDGADDGIERFRGWRGSLAGEASWTPQRRFARAFDRLSLPGFGRAARFEFLVTLGAAGVYDLEADALHVAVAHDDATTLAAKRALGSGDALLLERRVRALAEAAGVPVAAFDRGLALWDGTAPLEASEHGAIRRALRLQSAGGGPTA